MRRIRPTAINLIGFQRPWIGAENRGNRGIVDLYELNKNPVPLNQRGTQVSCADPSDYNRNGVANDASGTDGFPLEGNFSGSRKAGVSRGTTGLELEP